jgi:hypothetical protein
MTKEQLKLLETLFLKHTLPNMENIFQFTEEDMFALPSYGSL